MKILVSALMLMASLAFVLAGCSDNAMSPVTESQQTTGVVGSPADLAKKGECLHSATGIAYWKEVGAQRRVRFIFCAAQLFNGTATGYVRSNDGDQIFQCEAKVYDLVVEGNMAKMCFKFTRGSLTPPGGPSYDLTGLVGCVVVVNKGSGGGDRASWVWFDPPGTYYDFLGMTIEQLFALGATDYVNLVLAVTGQTYDQFLAPIDRGFVQVQ